MLSTHCIIYKLGYQHVLVHNADCSVLFSVHSAALVSDAIKIDVGAICVTAGVCTHSYIDYNTVNYKSRVPTVAVVVLALWDICLLTDVCMKAGQIINSAS